FARRYLQRTDALGARLVSGSDTLTIVGVAEDGKYVSLGEDPLPFVWRAAHQFPPAMGTLVVRSSPGVRTLTEGIRQTISDVNRDAAITGVLASDQHLSLVLLPQRVGAWVLGLLGAVGLALAAVGV